MYKNQKGASYLTILVGLVALAFVVKAVTAVWPSYWDDRVVNKQIEELISSSSSDITENQFVEKMDKSLEMNNIRDLKFDDIAQVSTENGIVVSKQYEVRVPFLLNIDLILTFEKSFDQRSVQSQ
ncbi:DUF4845 domain-containing protein [Acinetobacter shaoyimingii]|uniref:DUF4845 domain-containing protein n=1 Tax=Acinetobacter shaoyimingii TaxID=2715164 RepID=A0A6G8RUI0_9GAMM|nr:DUF4845 domain-containing protein [Acinetobacter shaoyimingii]QIO05574.1 DUF4845 domain-containing protein [Acinetobacter shaoyimingii]